MDLVGLQQNQQHVVRSVQVTAFINLSLLSTLLNIYSNFIDIYVQANGKKYLILSAVHTAQHDSQSCQDQSLEWFGN